MANVITIKKSSVPANVPSAGQMAQGELAINTADKLLYSKTGSVVFQVFDGVYEPVDATLVRDDDAGYNNANWNTAFGWGNHASAGYLTGAHTHLQVDITDANDSNWNTAYNWGDHASAGYAVGSFLPLVGGILTGSLTIPNGANYYGKDSGGTGKRLAGIGGDDKNYFGIDVIDTKIGPSGATGRLDLRFATVYMCGDALGHFEKFTGGFGSVQVTGADGSAGWAGYNIEAELAFMWNTASKRGGLYNDYGNGWFVQCYSGGAVQLYQAGIEKLRTTTTGIQVTGALYLNDLNTKLAEASGSSMRLTTPSGYFEFGPQNTTFCHMQTDRGAFYFNKEVQFAGRIKRYNKGVHPYYDDSTYLGGKITVSSSAPSSPAKGDQWFDTS